jgi:hypothetical protein
MTDADSPKEGQLILYQTPAGAVRVEVLYESETFWLSQKKMAELFGVEIPTISYHLKEVYDSGELSREATLRKFRTVQQEGHRAVSREIEFYNLDAIISVGYRVNSVQATRFRIWATQNLREFVIIESVCNPFREATIRKSWIVRRAGIALDCPRPVKAGGL